MALLVLTSVLSTMDVSREMLKLGQVEFLPDGRLEPSGVLALEQTEGRGQRGRVWHVEAGQSLCATYFISLSREEVENGGRLAIIAGVAAVNAVNEAIRGSANPHGIPKSEWADIVCEGLGLKWPNDIILNGKKLGGILIEVTAISGHYIALIGVGINLTNTQFPLDIALRATSLASEGYPAITPYAIGNTLYRCIEEALEQTRSRSFASTLAKWQAMDKTVGLRFQVDTEGGPEYGIATSVDKEGCLILELDSGCFCTISSAAVLSDVSST